MRLKDAAKHFDKERIYDAYSGAFLFKCQSAGFDDSSSTGATARRRTLSVAPGTTIPTRRAVKLFDEFLIVSAKTSDGFLGTEVRESYGMKKSTGLLQAVTPGQACLSTSSTPFHAYKSYFKDLINVQTSSQYDLFWNIYCWTGENVSRGTFLRDATNRLFRVRNAYTDVEEFRVCETDELDADALQTATFVTNGVLNPVTDSYPSVTTVTGVIQVDFPKFYLFRTQNEAEVKPGDLTVFIAASVLTPKVGGVFTMAGKNYTIKAVVPELDSWAMHVRLA